MLRDASLSVADLELRGNGISVPFPVSPDWFADWFAARLRVPADKCFSFEFVSDGWSMRQGDDVVLPAPDPGNY